MHPCTPEWPENPSFWSRLFETLNQRDIVKNLIFRWREALYTQAQQLVQVKWRIFTVTLCFPWQTGSSSRSSFYLSKTISSSSTGCAQRWNVHVELCAPYFPGQPHHLGWDACACPRLHQHCYWHHPQQGGNHQDLLSSCLPLITVTMSYFGGHHPQKYGQCHQDDKDVSGTLQLA